MFITFEGIDLSGKSTQAKLLYDFLLSKNKKSVLLREPGGTKISEKVRDILLDKKNSNMFPMTEFLLFSSARYQLTHEIVKPLLKKNYYVISDRYYDSSTAYQGYGGKVKPEVINTINKIAAGSLKPDVTFLIDISFDESNKRRKKSGKLHDRMEEKNEKYFKKVVAGFRKIAKANPERFIKINGNKEINTIHKQITKLLEL